MLHEVPGHAGHPNEWTQRLNAFESSSLCDPSPRRDPPPIENIAKLMQYAALATAQAPWPPSWALSHTLAQPLTGDERQSLAPNLAWPREVLFRTLSDDGERLEARKLFKQARYPGASPGAIVVRGEPQEAAPKEGARTSPDRRRVP